jgi:uroporphyrinogen III methyltransferase/synthase
MKGKVYIVGAGPGDTGLLTVRGLKYLQMADTIVYDFHLNAQVLNMASEEAEFIYAGKRGGTHTMKQEEINRVLVQKAKEGHIVCRLKGGDPFVFGRGGEEAEALSAEGIDFEIVPGVSSAIAAPAYAGIPLTHRLYSSSLAIVPGYEDPSKKESSIDWAKLSQGVGTIVFLMTVRNIAMVCRKLIDNGRSPKTPVAVVRWGTRADQTTIVSNLEEIADTVKEKDIRPPAVMVVGEVVNLREHLRWYEKKPLFGYRILVTREDSGDLMKLENLGAEIIYFPTIKVVPPSDWRQLDGAIDGIGTYNWMIFTSANAVRYFFERFFERDRDIRDLKGLRICSIGTKTASAVRGYGLKIDLIPEKFNAEGLVESFTKMESRGTVSSKSSISGNQTLKGIRFVLPRAEVAREVLPEKIRELGGEIDVVTAYRAIKPDVHGKRLRRFLKEGKISVATFTSAATFHNFISIIDEDVHDLLKGVSIAVIGPVTARAVEKAGYSVDIMPEEATVDALASRIIDWAAKR